MSLRDDIAALPPPCRTPAHGVMWKPANAEPGPLRRMLEQPPTEEEKALAANERDKRKVKSAAQPRSEKGTASVPSPNCHLPSPAAKPPAQKRKHFLLHLVKAKMDYTLEYVLQSDKSWLLMDCPGQFEGLKAIPIEQHGEWIKRACYTEWKREYLWK